MVDVVLISKEAARKGLSAFARALGVRIPQTEADRLAENLSESRLSWIQVRGDAYFIVRRDPSIIDLVLWFTKSDRELDGIPTLCRTAVEEEFQNPECIASRHRNQIRVRARTNVSVDELMRLVDHYRHATAS